MNFEFRVSKIIEITIEQVVIFRKLNFCLKCVIKNIFLFFNFSIILSVMLPGCYNYLQMKNIFFSITKYFYLTSTFFMIRYL